ncbi:MAG: hypothetical protein PHP87_11350, partial [Syntrophomonas sp.]
PQRYADLWDLFKEVKNSYDEEAFEVMLADAALREDFYQRLADYSKTLGLALSVEAFIMNCAEATLKRYKSDLKRFQKLKAAVKLRYAEAIDYRDFEPKIKKLLDVHIQANEVIQLNEPVNIFDDNAFLAIKEERGVYETKSKAARADAIAHATKKAITEKMEEDPAFYEKFSLLIQQAIDGFRAKRISDLEYLNLVSEIRNKVVTRQHDDMPETLLGNEDAMAYYGVLKPFFMNSPGKDKCQTLSAQTALAIQEILQRHWKVQFWDDDVSQNQAINEIDDYLYDKIRGVHGVELSEEQMDDIIEKTLQIARHRSSK